MQYHKDELKSYLSGSIQIIACNINLNFNTFFIAVNVQLSVWKPIHFALIL